MSDFERNDMFNDGDDYGTGGYESDMAGVGKGKKRNKKTRGKKVEGKITMALVALAVAFIAWVVLVVLESKIVNSEEKVKVVVATVEVPAGIELTQTNMLNYFALEERNKNDIPVGVTVYDNGNPMIGKITDRVIHAKEVVTNECFYEKSFFDGIEDAVELSLDLGAIGQTVGGTLRPGDKVDIKAVIRIDKNSFFGEMNGTEDLLDMGESADDIFDIENMDTIEPVEGEIAEEEVIQGSPTISSKDAIVLNQNGMLDFAKDVEVSFGITGEYVAQVIAEDIVIVEVFNSGGETLSVVEAAGGNMVATVINVAVPSQLVDAILIAQKEGTLTLSKIYEDAVEEDSVEDVVAEDATVSTDGAEGTPASSEVSAQ